MTRYMLPVLMAGWMSPMVWGQSDKAGHLKTEISFYADAMVNSVRDEHRVRAHEAMKSAMDSLLLLRDSYTISLDSIPWLSVLKADGFRIVTWQLKLSDEEYRYGGFIQTPDILTPLKDTRPFINGSSFSTYMPGAWYGSLYYQILPFERHGKSYYILLGFNAESSQLNTKVADVLDMTGSEPLFGVPVFAGKGETMTRILLTYADLSTVHISYDSIFGGLIHDHLENLHGVGPHGEPMPVSDGSAEGWVLKDGTWNYVEEAFDVPSAEPPMMDDRKDRKEEKDILGRPRKQ